MDLTVYSIIIPVMPFQLERLGYTDVSSLTGWLLFSFVRLICFIRWKETFRRPVSGLVRWLSDMYVMLNFKLFDERLFFV